MAGGPDGTDAGFGRERFQTVPYILRSLKLRITGFHGNGVFLRALGIPFDRQEVSALKLHHPTARLVLQRKQALANSKRGSRSGDI